MFGKGTGQGQTRGKPSLAQVWTGRGCKWRGEQHLISQVSKRANIRAMSLSTYFVKIKPKPDNVMRFGAIHIGNAFTARSLTAIASMSVAEAACHGVSQCFSTKFID